MLDRIMQNPPLRIAVVGGGQLGKMMTMAAKQMGFHVTVLDPTSASPAAQVADRQITADFHDGQAIRQLAADADVITYEFEHIDSAALIALEEGGQPVYPAPQTLRVIQNKLTQKEALAQADIAVAPFMPVAGYAQAKEAGEKYGYPFLLKACTGGYDGKGNALVASEGELADALTSLGDCELMAEAFVPFTCEVSVMVARSVNGDIKSYPLSENEHEENILRRSIVPAQVDDAVAARARAVAEDVMSLFGSVGVFCVEMFVTKEGEVLVNEVAPRPHNSGHYTIESCITSQFEQQVRAICGLPLGATDLLTPAVMINLLGEDGHFGPAMLVGCAEALSLPGVHLHLYGKKQTAPKRKMGHVTVTGKSLAEVEKTAALASHALKVVAQKEDV
ncbi:5-(carboxyamino)imidazole ribonucleotide synthase [Dethiobacter alkaliphilus]|uniref:N5-carboxyaminoimidazole ribonucleotide synthase n=1 Tax=Dethiobacter alkaliphilus AHT 1 TaxID=555088 RepID=C0GHA1_DETAL|nr:5-(carboxyamino)imidazole ribonucleotide synthase [Dethiobacter alkaliphilus]EEG77403.1 phosphoribosylaminoimidazole carboxylase, ATPase subunit [Dethiobacter alkaliphilus AHT 1]